MEVEEEIQANPNPAATANPTANRQANRLRGWQHSSRIIRVSRASGGKDRHSKVWTSKGLRDRRVRLSVSTAIQFYDLQDRLGYDQPSKAVEWLINAASDAISELPSLDTHAFPDTPPKQLSSTTSDTTSKGSAAAAPTSVPPQNSSFTELLTSGIANNNNGSSSPADDHHQPNYFPARPHSMPMTMTMSMSMSMSMSLPPPFGIGPISASAPAPAPFLAEQQLIPMASQSQSSADMGGQSFWIGGGGSGAGLNNRGTLQSNSSLFNHNHNHNHHLQRFSNSNNSSTIDAAGSIPIFFAAADQHQHQLSAFDARLQLCYADATRHSDHKGKGKNSL